MRAVSADVCLTCAFAIATDRAHASSAFAADPTIKVAFWNVHPGKGVSALAGHAAPFVNITELHGYLAAAERLGRGRDAGGTRRSRRRSDGHRARPRVNPGATSAHHPTEVRQALGWSRRTR